MGSLRALPLFDATSQPSSWNERMTAGEVAVHASSTKAGVPGCLVFASMAEAEEYAQAEVLREPGLRLRLYGHEGFVGAPLREYAGAEFKGERDMSPRVRRWLGYGLLAVGVVLMAVDWRVDFALSWPSVVGSRLLIPGVILVVTDVLVMLTARQKARRENAR